MYESTCQLFFFKRMEYWLGSGLELLSAWSIEAVCQDSSVLRIREEPLSITWELQYLSQKSGLQTKRV